MKRKFKVGDEVICNDALNKDVKGVIIEEDTTLIWSFVIEGDFVNYLGDIVSRRNFTESELTHAEPEFEEGEIVEVKYSHGWEDKEFLFTDKNGKHWCKNDCEDDETFAYSFNTIRKKSKQNQQALDRIAKLEKIVSDASQELEELKKEV